MQDKLVSLYIRPHLISFLYEELEGNTKAIYETKKVKIVRVTKKSPLGQLLRVFKTRANSIEYANKIENYNVFISLDGTEIASSKVSITEGYHVQRVNREAKELTLLKEDVKCINDFLETIFKISLMQFLKGYVQENNNKNKIRQGIHLFMLEYNLYDTSIDPSNLRDFYYNNIAEEKDYLLNRLKTPISPKTLNFAIK